MGIWSCPELCCRCACLQPCLPNGPWIYSAVSSHPGWTPQSYATACLQPCLQLLLLLIGAPGQTLALLHHLCWELLTVPATAPGSACCGQPLWDGAWMVRAQPVLGSPLAADPSSFMGQSCSCCSLTVTSDRNTLQGLVSAASLGARFLFVTWVML